MGEFYSTIYEEASSTSTCPSSSRSSSVHASSPSENLPFHSEHPHGFRHWIRRWPPASRASRIEYACPTRIPSPAVSTSRCPPVALAHPMRNCPDATQYTSLSQKAPESISSWILSK